MNDDGFRVTQREGAVRFNVRVQPRSSREGVDGVHGDALRVRVNAPPVEGAANEAVIEVIAKALDLPRRAVTIVAGDSARTKLLDVTGVTVERVLALATPRRT